MVKEIAISILIDLICNIFQKKEIPVLIFSAGLADVIEEVTLKSIS